MKDEPCNDRIPYENDEDGENDEPGGELPLLDDGSGYPFLAARLYRRRIAVAAGLGGARR